MRQVIVAPSLEVQKHTSVFLGGGITGCADWQKEVCDFLKDEEITIFNPRRDKFDISDNTLTMQQIEWEFKRLECCDIFSMYFCNSESVQPICMYELGRNIVRMQSRFPLTWQHRIIVNVEPGYKRKDDVYWQMAWATDSHVLPTYGNAVYHAIAISNAVKRLGGWL